jgi:WD40 repeat protein
MESRTFEVSAEMPSPVRAVSFNPHACMGGQLLASAQDSGVFRLWDTRQQRRCLQYMNSNRHVRVPEYSSLWLSLYIVHAMYSHAVPSGSASACSD